MSVLDKNICWFQISIGDMVLDKKLYFKLFTDIVPKTCENFIKLCQGNNGKTVEDTDIKMTYKNSIFHRIINQFMIQGGDYTNFNGTGGISIYGEKFDDENFTTPCDKPGLLAMANAGPNTNGSQFFITTVPCHHLTGKHVVFGKILKNMSIVRQLEKTPTRNQDNPVAECKIVDCGAMTDAEYNEAQKAEVSGEAEADARYEDFPEDNAEELKDTENLEAAETIRQVGNDYFKKGNYLNSAKKYAKALRYLAVVLDTSATHEELKAKTVACNNNEAMCYLKLERWRDCEACTTAVLCQDKHNTKALYRRGMARLEIKDYEEAMMDFEAVLKIDSGNADAQAKLAETKQREMAQKAKMAKGFKKLFS